VKKAGKHWLTRLENHMKNAISNGNENSTLLAANLKHYEDTMDDFKLPIIKFKQNY
jgi:hypothetical protein